MITLRDLLILNLTLQVFDGLFSYQVFTLGAGEANPLVAAAISDAELFAGHALTARMRLERARGE